MKLKLDDNSSVSLAYLFKHSHYLSGYNWTSSILPKKLNKDFNWSLWHVVDILHTWTILLFEITVDI